MSSVALLIAEIAKIALFDKSVQKGQNRERSYFGLWDGLRGLVMKRNDAQLFSSYKCFSYLKALKTIFKSEMRTES